MRLATVETSFLGRGPPPVPRRISLVRVADCAPAGTAPPASGAARHAASSWRRVSTVIGGPFSEGGDVLRRGHGIDEQHAVVLIARHQEDVAGAPLTRQDALEEPGGSGLRRLVEEVDEE